VGSVRSGPGGEDMLRRWPTGGREGPVARLMALDSRGELDTEHARRSLGLLVSWRTVWNWVAVARRAGGVRTDSVMDRWTSDVRVRLAVRGGSVSAVHRELLAEAAAAGDPGAVPSLRTLQRAVRRDLSVGERARPKVGGAARRCCDVYGKRPPRHRNGCWEGDHRHVPVRVALDRAVVCPWETWFIDMASKVIVGWRSHRSSWPEFGWTEAWTYSRVRLRGRWAASRFPFTTCRPTSPTGRAPWRT
jgi:putative transposase